MDDFIVKIWTILDHTRTRLRQVYMRCRKDRQGVLRLESAREEVASQGNTERRRDYALRHLKLNILSINLTKDGKP